LGEGHIPAGTCRSVGLASASQLSSAQSPRFMLDATGFDSRAP